MVFRDGVLERPTRGLPFEAIDMGSISWQHFVQRPLHHALMIMNSTKTLADGIVNPFMVMCNGTGGLHCFDPETSRGQSLTQSPDQSC